MPRLVNAGALFSAVRKGVAAKTFAVAEDFRDGKYLELQFGDISCGEISSEYLLVKAEVAQKQLDLYKPPV